MTHLARDAQTSLSSASIDLVLCEGTIMRRGRLPLTALRSFEAAGRLLSFTSASEELFVSQAAISRQVRELEALVGKPLFLRHHRSVTLTAAGQSLLDVLSSAFDRVTAELAHLSRADQQMKLIVNAEPGFAAGWIAPRLAEFQDQNADIEILIESDVRLIDLRRHPAELAVRHSAEIRDWPHTHSRCLADVNLTPVLSPMLLNNGPGIRTPSDLLRYPLLHEDNRDLWGHWMKAAGIEAASYENGPIFSDSGIVQQSAVRGAGIALADELLAEEEISKGLLIRPFNLSISFGAYWLVARDFDKLSPGAARFATWLETSLQKT
jgi:LysR family transcriptional regulator, glycine cleavage system transcriptional activator